MLSHTASIIIQSRMGSTRLPGKIMKELVNGLSVLEVVIKRLQLCKHNFQIIIATTDNSIDDEIEQFCHSRSILCIRGSENDVLSRYYLANTLFPSKDVLRITSDCPLIDPTIVDEVYSFFLQGNYDYVSNVIERTFPRGLDVEVFSSAVLHLINSIADKDCEREHVTNYIYTHPSEFKIGSYKGLVDYSKYRLTVDTQEDLSLVRKVYKELNNLGLLFDFSLLDIISIMENNPEWVTENSDVIQKYDSQIAYLNSLC